MIVDGKEILRVFPRKTKATPDDDLVVIGTRGIRSFAERGGFDEIHVSVTYTYDIPKAEKMAKSWEKLGVPVKVGGPAYGDRMSPVFVPGLYVKKGMTFTSRGCHNHCWFCSVWQAAQGRLIELPITDGWNILDDNIMQTSPEHFCVVMDMLERQPERPIFSGGIEPAQLNFWRAEAMHRVKTQRLYCAYDTPDDYEPLVYAGRILREAGFRAEGHVCGCYVLIGYPKDTFEAAEERLIDTCKAGFMPYAMLYRDKAGQVDETWRRFQREWCRPIIAATKFKQYWNGGV